MSAKPTTWLFRFSAALTLAFLKLSSADSFANALDSDPGNIHPSIASTPGLVRKVIYNYAGHLTYCGDGHEGGMNSKGQMVWDVNSNTIAGVFTFGDGNQRSVSLVHMTNQQVYTLKGAYGAEYTAISIAESSGPNSISPYFEQDLIKGRRFSVKIGKSNFKVPNSMTDSEIFVDYSEGEPVLVEEKGTYLLDVQASAASNTAGESVDDAANRLKQFYLQHGYADGDQ